MIPRGYNVSVIKMFGATTIFWIVIYGILFFYTLNLAEVPASTSQIVASIVAGLAVGAFVGIISTKNQIGRLSKNYKFSTTGKDIVLNVVSIVLFCIFGAVLSWSTILFSVYFFGVSTLITRWVFFFNFEKKEDMRLMQSWWGTEIFLVPKAPSEAKQASIE
jgi:hypothetical protein